MIRMSIKETQPYELHANVTSPPPKPRKHRCKTHDKHIPFFHPSKILDYNWVYLYMTFSCWIFNTSGCFKWGVFETFTFLQKAFCVNSETPTCLPLRVSFNVHPEAKTSFSYLSSSPPYLCTFWHNQETSISSGRKQQKTQTVPSWSHSFLPRLSRIFRLTSAGTP